MIDKVNSSKQQAQNYSGAGLWLWQAVAAEWKVNNDRNVEMATKGKFHNATISLWQQQTEVAVELEEMTYYNSDYFSKVKVIYMQQSTLGKQESNIHT